jgi:hypothetical protein
MRAIAAAAVSLTAAAVSLTAAAVSLTAAAVSLTAVLSLAAPVWVRRPAACTHTRRLPSLVGAHANGLGTSHGVRCFRKRRPPTGRHAQDNARWLDRVRHPAQRRGARVAALMEQLREPRCGSLTHLQLEAVVRAVVLERWSRSFF